MNILVKNGTLYIVSTPIGNLDDITIRGVRVLSDVDLIAAEDTRKTKILLTHYNINKPMVSYFSYNEQKRIPKILDVLKAGQSVALVSEAGTPGISDPAVGVVRAALVERLPVVAIPGPTAFLPALITSGLPSEKFVFVGFLPLKKGRNSYLELLSRERKTVIIYESPHRLLKTLNEILNVFGNRKISVSRELTKKFEEIVHGYLTEIITHFTKNRIRGEFVIVIDGRWDYSR
jgi:16S rRNA (cytidine1402-2'-O)-methyltransferase